MDRILNQQSKYRDKLLVSRYKWEWIEHIRHTNDEVDLKIVSFLSSQSRI